MIARHVGLLLGASVVVVVAAAADPPPWYGALGLRAGSVAARVPVADRVVLVPDEATFIDEVSRWSLAARWPVLIEDDWFAPRFVRGFKPRVVERRESVGSPRPAGEALRTAVDRTVASAWTVPGSSATPATSRAAFDAVQFVPAGMVLIREGDPLLCAGLALAAWHGQVVAWSDAPLQSLGAVLPAAQTQQGVDAVEAAARACGYPALALGDAIETVTVAHQSAIKATLPNSPQFAQAPGSYSPEPAALSDALCRNADGSRWAIASMIVGDMPQSVAMAMGAIFLPREDALLWNGYPDSSPWNAYGFSRAAPMLAEAGLREDLREGSSAGITDYRVAGSRGLQAPFHCINSKGNWDFFDLADDSRGDAYDIPPLATPTALSMIHSFSLQMPAYAPSIGARWLDHGVYAYVGSVQEPMLQAFVPPELLVERVRQLVPFLVASRWLEGQGDRCWRIALIGDPLMQIEPPAAFKVPARLDPATLPAPLRAGCTSLRTGALELLSRTKSGSADPALLGGAARDIALLGDSKLAAACFPIAESLTPAAAQAVAPFALESLFLVGDSAAFGRAFALIDAPTLRQQDLLWAMWTPVISATMDRTALELLAKNPRQPRAHVDLDRILPALQRALGNAAARAAVENAIKNCPDDGGRDKLRAQLAKLG